MRMAIRASLWALFCLLVLAGGWLFLRACGTWPVFGWARNFCPLPLARTDAAREGEDLRRQVHAAEIALAETPICPVPEPAPLPPPPPPRRAEPSPAPAPTPQRAESQSLDRTVEERGGKRGRLQLTLAWNTLDDLDINVDCPGGRISSAKFGPGICGDGIKDIDANRNLTENVSSDPIENVSWTEDVPPGAYKIEVINYRPKYKTGAKVPFTLRMRWNDQERICRDEVITLPDSEIRTVDGQTMSGSARTLTWQSGGDLPECNFQVVKTYRGSASK